MANKKENPNRHEFTLKREGENWTKLVNEAFEKVRKEAKVDGFRKGKVTKEIFDKKFGKQEYLVEAANKAVGEEFVRIMKENNYELVAEPQIHVTTLTEETLEFTMALIEQPTVKVKKYKGLKVTKEEVKVTDEEVEHEISHLLERFSELVAKEDGEVEVGNVAVIDYEGSVDGVAFDGGKSENYPLEIGSGMFIPGFEEQLVGMKKCEERDITVTFPEEYHADELAGKEAVFKVKVNEIKVRQNRELDEDFFEDLGMEGVNSEDTLKEEIKKSIASHKEYHAEEKYINDLIEAVCKETEVDIPEEMVFDTVEKMYEDMSYRLSMQGISMDMYLQISNKTEEDIKNEMEPEAFSRVLARLTLEEIKKLENIEVTEEEVDNKLKELADNHGMKEEEIIKQIGSREMLKYDLEMNKVLDLLKEESK